MKIENPAAFQFFMQDDIYLLNKDKTVFVDTPPALPEIEIQAPAFNYLGANQKNFLVIVHYPETEFINEKHLTALESTIKRLGFALDEIAIINRAKYPLALLDDLVTFFKPLKLLFLGKNALTPKIEPLTINKLHLINNCKALYTFSFDEMMENAENKKVFWEQMKQF